MSEEKKSIVQNQPKTSIGGSIITSILILLPISIFALIFSAGGSYIYSLCSYNRNYTSGFGYHEYLSPLNGIFGIIIYVLINILYYMICNKIINSLKYYNKNVGKVIFIIFSCITNFIMLIIYFQLFGNYSFENNILDFFNKFFVVQGHFLFPIIFAIKYSCNKKD